MHFTNKRILVYANEDDLNLLTDYFKLFNYNNVIYYSMYESTNYEKINADEFIDNNKRKDVIVISSDSICKHFKKSVIINYDGLTYNLVTDIDKELILLNSFYEFSKKLVKEIF